MQENKALTIVGWGNQARAWAQNLRDSGWEISIALRKESSSIEQVKANNFSLLDIDEACSSSKSLALLIPDHVIPDFLKSNYESLKDETRLIYAHGHAFVSHDFNSNYPKVQHCLLAPKAIASELRKQYLSKGLLGAAYTVEAQKGKEQSEAFLLELAKGLGINAGPYLCSFENETKADLLSEQSILCSLLPYGAQKCFDILVKEGVPEEVAYFECWQEMSLIAKTLVDKGPLAFFQMISPNALIGGKKGAERLFDKEYQSRLETLWQDIHDGTFEKEIRETDFEKTKADMAAFWKNQKLQECHDRITGNENEVEHKET